jgi:4-hydroxy-3-methylbut-2-enyl diphosphate reductase
VLVPLRIERLALGRIRDAQTLLTGMGPVKAAATALRAAALEPSAVAVVGVCGGISPELRPGDVICATELHGLAQPVVVPGAGAMASALARAGVEARIGPLLCTDHIVGPAERATHEASGVLGVEMESAWLAPAAAGAPFAVVRVVIDAAGHSLFDPRILPAVITAWKGLRRTAPAVAAWAAAAGMVEES